jgi:hypothetical protein
MSKIQTRSSIFSSFTVEAYDEKKNTNGEQIQYVCVGIKEAETRENSLY